MNYKKITLSASVIAFVSALVFGGTQAFFSDEETSTGNTFTAGAIDLQIDNSSYGFDWNRPGENDPTGEWGENPDNSWDLDDLTDQLFFSFVDLKPGDYGEDTISIHVNDNDAWACMALNLTDTPENGINGPEADAGDTTEDEGELQNYLSFIFWWDDGDNVLEDDEVVIDSLSGLSGEIFSGNWLAIAEAGDEPLEGGETQYLGKGWCFGEITEAPVAQDNADDNPPSAPDRIGFTCDGSGDHNDAQTDGIEVDVAFHAVQSRHNDDFTCSELPPLEEEEERPLVGALQAAYVDPEQDQNDACDFTVLNDDLIQTAISDASDGDTICVDSSYNGGDSFPVHVNKEVKIAGLGAKGDAKIPGGFFIDASNVTVTGLEFTDFTSGIQSSGNAAVYIHNEAGQGTGDALTGTTISHNIFTAPGGAKGDDAKAIMTEIGSGSVFANAIEVMHNEITGWNQGMFFNTANADVHHNDIIDNNVGIANDGPDSTSIHHNDFEDNDTEAVGVNQGARGGATTDGVLTVNTNNLAPAGTTSGNEVNQYGDDGEPNVDATGNWWDGDAEGDRTNDTTEVDTSGEEASPFPEN